MEKVVDVEKVEDLIAKIIQDEDLIDEHKSCNDDSVKLLWDVLKFLSSDDIKREQYEEFTNQLNLLSAKSHKHMKEVYRNGTDRRWRRLYTDCMLLNALLTLRKEALGDEEKIQSAHNAIKGLDMAIIVAGAPGRDRMEVIQDTIKVLQSNLERANLSPKRNSDRSIITEQKTLDSFCMGQEPIPTLNEVPDIERFLSVCQSSPYVIRQGASNWPTFQAEGVEDDHLLSNWSSIKYLLEVSGPGRSVPVEIGKNYMDKEWSQRIMSWEDFLSGIDWDEKSDDQDDDKLCKDDHLSIRYLAQYNLFDQYPQLRKDILFPDLLFSSPLAPDCFPSYKPLIDSEDGMETFVLNAWLGPRSTVSPAHRDPHYNYYAQVVGQKLVWIAPPQKEIEKELKLEDGISSQIDVFDEQTFNLYPEFVKIVQSKSMFAILQPGDTLIIPPGWFHAFKSLTKSFSVSMWF